MPEPDLIATPLKITTEKKGGHGRRKLPADLRRETEVLDIPESVQLLIALKTWLDEVAIIRCNDLLGGLHDVYLPPSPLLNNDLTDICNGRRRIPMHHAMAVGTQNRKISELGHALA